MSDDIDNQQKDLEHYKSYINSILEENNNSIVFISTHKNILKEYLKNSGYKNYYINEFVFTDIHEGTRALHLDDNDLFEHLKETLSDMYCLSKCDKIYRIANWFSGFLFFACTFNQSNTPNTQRFIPEQPIIPLQ